MLEQDWLAKVKENATVLEEFIEEFHPSNLRPHTDFEEMFSNITAPNAERACELVRERIRKEEVSVRPEVRFRNALEKNEWSTIASLLSSAWFGVPESTDCWRIPGFSLAVNLLEDPVEYDGPPE